MSIRGSNFDNQHPFASDHALVWERCMPDGLLYGVEMSFTPTLFTLGTGFMLIAGRAFEITAAESVSISPGSGYARVYVTIDTGGTATKNSFDQVNFGVDYAANIDSFAELTQEEININQGAAVYQAEVAVLDINSSGVTAIERQMELVSPGAGTGAFAAIGVTYPAGATVTVTDGKITYTAPNTNGGALFIIPYAATWIVTATDRTETASQSVEITTEGQSVSVELSFALWLFKDGNEFPAITGGWTTSGYRIESKPMGTLTNDGTALVFTGQVGVSYGAGGTANPIDVTNANTLYAKGSQNNAGSQRSIALAASKNITFATLAAIYSIDGLSGDFEAALDVSNLSGEYYVVAIYPGKLYEAVIK